MPNFLLRPPADDSHVSPERKAFSEINIDADGEPQTPPAKAKPAAEAKSPGAKKKKSKKTNKKQKVADAQPAMDTAADVRAHSSPTEPAPKKAAAAPEQPAAKPAPPLPKWDCPRCSAHIDGELDLCPFCTVAAQQCHWFVSEDKKKKKEEEGR